MNLFDPKIANSICRAELDRFRQDFPTHLDKVYVDVLIWAANEVERQHDGPLDVPKMVDAYNYANRYIDGDINLKQILFLGYLVDRDENAYGFRRHEVYVGGPWNLKLRWEQIPRQLPLLLEAQDSMTPTDWYKEFEEIHPFADGNGRVGSILWNYLNGSLDNPQYPPDVYDPDFFTANREDDTFV